MSVGRIPRAVWEYDPRARALDEQLDRIDCEISGLRRLQIADIRSNLDDLGFDSSGMRPLDPRPWESRSARREARRVRAALRGGNLPRDYATGRVLCERRACGEVLGVR